jgi:hypothetical protein
VGRKLKFGDIVEIKTSKGLAYAMYTHRHTKHPKYGAVIQLFDRNYDTRPPDLTDVVRAPIRFATFFPLQAAVNQELVEVVGNLPVPESLESFPVFRSANIDPSTKQVRDWWLRDLETEKTWRVTALTPEQRKLPILAVWNQAYLVHRIEEGWRPENDSR